MKCKCLKCQHEWMSRQSWMDVEEKPPKQCPKCKSYTYNQERKKPLGPEDYIKIFGEECRTLIESSLAFLDKTEPSWNLEVPIDKRAYLKDLIGRAKKPQPNEPLYNKVGK